MGSLPGWVHGLGAAAETPEGSQQCIGLWGDECCLHSFKFCIWWWRFFSCPVVHFGICVQVRSTLSLVLFLQWSKDNQHKPALLCCESQWDWTAANSSPSHVCAIAVGLFAPPALRKDQNYSCSVCLSSVCAWRRAMLRRPPPKLRKNTEPLTCWEAAAAPQHWGWGDLGWALCLPSAPGVRLVTKAVYPTRKCWEGCCVATVFIAASGVRGLIATRI